MEPVGKYYEWPNKRIESNSSARNRSREIVVNQAVKVFAKDRPPPAKAAPEKANGNLKVTAGNSLRRS